MPANVSIGGTWLFNETINWPYEFDRNYDAAFSTESPNISYIEFNIRYYNLTDEPYFTLAFFYYLFEGVSLVVYDSRTGWVDEGYRTITFYDGETMSPEGYEWLTANATPFTPSVAAPVIDPLSMWLGYQAGQWVVRQRGKRQEPQSPVPVAYVYPQLVLPDIETAYAAFADEIDVTVEQAKEMAPYAVILTDGVSIYLYICNFELSIDVNEKLNNSDGGLCFIYWSHDESWFASGSQFVDAGGFNINPSYCVWTSHDILNADGTVYLSAFTPVPAGNGMAVYKGVRLPKLPEWDKTVYPYAYIVLWNSKAYYICLSNKPLEVYLGGTVINAQAAYLLSDGIWTEVSSKLNYSGAEWSNTDVYYAESVVDYGGTLYLAASDPVPVYE